MSDNGQKNQSRKTRQGQTTNPFARALAETEKSTYNNQQSLPNDIFSEALARSGAGVDDSFGADDEFWQKQQLEELEKQKRREALRKKLHDQVNPVDNQDLFNAREQQVKKEIDELRKELKLLAQEISKFHKEVEVAVMGDVVNPGQDGTYYVNFFQQLRAFILMLRQKIHSARTWATQFQNKKSKKARRGGLMSLEGKDSHEQTKTIFDMMHHEVSNARAGG